MLRIKSLVGIIALMLIGSMAARGEAPTSQPSKPEKSQTKLVRLTLPWSKITLTDDQKAQIGEIHVKANAEVKAIRDKEEEQIMSLLSDEQKAELKKYEEDRKAQEKADRAEKKNAAKNADSSSKKD